MKRILLRIYVVLKSIHLPRFRKATQKETDTQQRTRTTTAEVSILALSIFVLLSIATIGFLVSRPPFEFGFNAATIASGSLLFAVSLFLVSLEFFILAIGYPQRITYFSFIGSSLYGIGLMSMIVGITMALQSFQMGFIPYLFLTLLVVGYIIYYVIRIIKIGLEKPYLWRIVSRVICFSILGIGYLLLSKIGG